MMSAPLITPVFTDNVLYFSQPGVITSAARAICPNVGLFSFEIKKKLDLQIITSCFATQHFQRAQIGSWGIDAKLI